MHNGDVASGVRTLSSLGVAAACAMFAACGLDIEGTLVDDGDAAAPLDGNVADVILGADGGADVTSGDAASDVGDGSVTDGSMADARDASGLDAASDTAIDVQLDAPRDVAPDTATCTLATGCIVVPTGWTLVAIDTVATPPACPTGFAGAAANDVVEGPNAGATACGCATCSIGTQPDCSSGAVKVAFDFGGGQCGTAGSPPQNNNTPAGSCGTDMYTGTLNNLELKLTPSGPTGGACTSAGALQKQNVTYAGRARVCQPDSPAAAGCNGNQCTPTLPAAYSACIAMAGNQACPAPMTVKHRVGSDVSYTCAACPCSVGAKCSGTMTLYRDNQCTSMPHVLAVDDVCHPSGTNQSYSSYKYTGTASNVTCAPGAAPAPQNLALVGEETICCAP